MSDEYLIDFCSPTLASLKTGSLFNSPYEFEEKLQQWLAAKNSELNLRGDSPAAVTALQQACADLRLSAQCTGERPQREGCSGVSQGMRISFAGKYGFVPLSSKTEGRRLWPAVSARNWHLSRLPAL